MPSTYLRGRVSSSPPALKGSASAHRVCHLVWMARESKLVCSGVDASWEVLEDTVNQSCKVGRARESAVSA